MDAVCKHLALQPIRLFIHGASDAGCLHARRIDDNSQSYIIYFACQENRRALHALDSAHVSHFSLDDACTSTDKTTGILDGLYQLNELGLLCLVVRTSFSWIQTRFYTDEGSWTVEMTCEAATRLAHLHAVGLRNLRTDAMRAVVARNTRDYGREMCRGRVFPSLLCGHFDDVHAVQLRFLKVLSEEDWPDDESERVLCHGRATTQSFGWSSSNQVVAVVDFSHACFRPAMWDLAFLLLSALPPHLRRVYQTVVLKQYFYTMIDIRRPSPQLGLEALHRSYSRQFRDAFLWWTRRLATEKSTVDQTLAHKWRLTLDETIDHMTRCKPS